MQKRKIVSACFAFLILCCAFAGCASAKHGATLYSSAGEWVSEEFSEQNRISGAYYLNENYTALHGSEPKRIQYPSETPERSFIITEEEEYSRILADSPISIDFDREMVVLYTCADASQREYRMKELAFSDKTLTVSVKLKYRNANDSVMPYQRWFMLVTKKTEISEVEFKKIRR